MGIGSLFKGIENQEVGFTGQYLTAGHYLLRIDEVKVKENREGRDIFIVESTVVHVFRDGNGLRPGDAGYSGHNVGDSVSQVIRRGDYFLKEVKQFIMAATGVSKEEVSMADTLAVVGYNEAGQYVGNEPLNGRYFVMECNNPFVQSKKAVNEDGTPKEFPRVSWKRRVPASEVKTQIPASLQEQFFTVEGNNQLDVLIAAGL